MLTPEVEALNNQLLQRIMKLKAQTKKKQEEFYQKEDAQQKNLRLERAGIVVSKCPYGLCDGQGKIINTNNTASICQCAKDESRKTKNVVAGIPEKFKGLKVDTFNCELYQEQDNIILACHAKDAAIAYLTNFKENYQNGEGLYLYSSTKGSGKTRLAVSIANAIMSVYKKEVKFMRYLELLSKIKESYSKEAPYSENQIITKVCEMPVLVLDDFGIGSATDTDNKILTRIIENRGTENKVTIITSNLLLEDLPYDERIKSKLKEQVRMIKMPEESVREQIAKQRDMEFGKQIELLWQ